MNRGALWQMAGEKPLFLTIHLMILLLWGEATLAASSLMMPPPRNTVFLSSKQGIAPSSSVEPLFSPPGEKASPEQREAWNAALRTETEYVASFIEGLVNTEVVDEAHGNLENLLKPELVRVYAENVVGDSGIGIAEKVYKELMVSHDKATATSNAGQSSLPL